MRWEVSLLSSLHEFLGCAPADAFFRAATQLGDKTVLAFLFLLTAFFFWLRRERRRLWTTVGLGLAALLLEEALKILTVRPRPQLWPWLASAQGWAFPSGHALGAAVFYGWCALLLAEELPERKRLWAALAAGMVLTVGLSRLYLGMHWPTDVLGGWALGGGLLATAVWLYGRQPPPCVEGLDPNARDGVERLSLRT